MWMNFTPGRWARAGLNPKKAKNGTLFAVISFIFWG
jgi:hypothetical protein